MPRSTRVSTMTLYELLGVPADASREEVHQAYLAKAKEAHPDRVAGAPEEVRAAALRKMTLLNEAWRVLGDAAERARYDASLRADGPSSFGSAPGPFDDRGENP